MPDLIAYAPRPGGPVRRFTRRLRQDTRGLALLEFAFSLPLVLGIGLYGIEIANFALMHLRVSQIALNLADNASRVGVDSTLSQVQIREVDMNDVLDGARRQGEAWELTRYGRIIVSSLEKKDGVQRIHWQRCVGLKNADNYRSSYGDASVTDGTDQTVANNGKVRNEGMGDASSVVHSPEGAGVMFVEVNYPYQPVVSARWLPSDTTRIHYVASFLVRDRRDLRQIYSPGGRSTCNKYTLAPAT